MLYASACLRENSQRKDLVPSHVTLCRVKVNISIYMAFEPFLSVLHQPSKHNYLFLENCLFLENVGKEYITLLEVFLFFFFCVFLILQNGATRLLCPWDFPGKDTGVGCHFLLQEIFLIQGLNPGLLHCRQTLPSEPPGKPQFYRMSLYYFMMEKMSVYTYTSKGSNRIGSVHSFFQFFKDCFFFFDVDHLKSH